TAAAQPSTVVRVPKAMAIGPQSSELAAAFTAAIQTALVRSGVRVVTDTVPALAGAVRGPRYLVETTVQRSGDRVRAQVRLFRADPDSSLWADQLDFRVND